MPRTVLYCRVSTAEQTIESQLEQAKEAGFTIDQVIEDHGVSGVTTKLSERDGGKRLFDILRDGDTLLVRWIDRLGRNYDDIQSNIRHFIDQGVTIKTVINGMTFDANPKDAMSKAIRDAILSFMAALAEANAVAAKEAQAAGIKRYKEQSGANPYRGRKPVYNEDEYNAALEMKAQGIGVNEIARRLGKSKHVISRLLANPDAAYASLQNWGMVHDPKRGRMTGFARTTRIPLNVNFPKKRKAE